MTVDIVLTYFKTDHLIKKCLGNLLKSSHEDFTIYLVDNMLGKGNKFADLDPRIKVVRGLKQPTGSSFARGRHHPDGIIKGIKSGSAPYVALVEADCWPIQRNWIEQCMDYLKVPGAELVGIQDEASIPLTFHFFERRTLKKYKHKYNVKVGFNKKDLKMVQYPDVFVPRRKKWRFGEYWPFEIYKRGGKTVGLNPTKACVMPGTEVQGDDWLSFISKGGGIIYGDLIFHFCKGYRRQEKTKLNRSFYESDEYLDHVATPSSSEVFTVNEGMHMNAMYKFDKLSVRK